MNLTARGKAAPATAAAILIAGFTTIALSVTRDNAAGSIGGACLVTVALTLVALTFIRDWITDTRDERAALAAAQRQATEQRATYIAAQAALENEAGRLNRDTAEQRRRIAAQLVAEREAMAREFEERRATLVCETMEATVLMIRSGKFDPGRAPAGNLIQFPERHSQRTTPLSEPERSREHGVVGP